MGSICDDDASREHWTDRKFKAKLKSNRALLGQPGRDLEVDDKNRVDADAVLALIERLEEEVDGG